MTDFEIKVDEQAQKAIVAIEKWTKEKNAQEVIKDFLNEVDEETGNTNLRDLLRAKKKLATKANNELVRLEAQKSFIKLANGGEEGGKGVGISSHIFQPTIVVNPVKGDETKIINN